jgi:arylsulfatase A-like enzyme
MARQGLTFTQAWSCPVCTPTRAQMMTGRYGHRTGMGTPILDRELIDNPGIHEDVALLPQYLHGAPTPYTCAAVGKWHLADRYQMLDNPQHPLGLPVGTWFDRYAGTIFNLVKPPGVPVTESSYWIWEKTYCSYVQLAVNPCDVGDPPCVVERDGHASVNQYATVDTIDDALALSQELPEPWFLYVAPHAMHAPLNDPPIDAPVTTCGTYGPPAIGCDYGAYGLGTPFERGRCMLESLDGQLGRLLCALDPADTTVIVVGDNGPAKRAVAAPYNPARSKNTVYQNGIEVPLIIRSPLLNPTLVGTRCDALVSTIDVFATILDIAQIQPSSVPSADSVSLVPCLTTPNAAPRTTIYSEAFNPNFVPDPNTPNGVPPGYFAKRHDQAVRDARFKLIRKWRREHTTGIPFYVEELYDLVEGALDEATVPPTPIPDWLELNDLLASGDPLTIEAQQSLDALRLELDVQHPTVMQ